MAVELTPNGTYGAPMPHIPSFLQPLVFGLVSIVLKLRGGRILTLVTVGAKSGKERRLPLAWFADGDSAWIIVASSGGAAKHPGWYYNLARNPDKAWIEINGLKVQVQAESLKGATYSEVWDRITRQAKGYIAYKANTDRLIPVIRLTSKG